MRTNGQWHGSLPKPLKNGEMQDGCRLLLLQDDDFPEMLTQGITAPPVLFLRGNAELLHTPSAAIVGSRHATPQAMRIAKDFSRA